MPPSAADGRYVAFATNATNLLPAGVDSNGKTDIYRKDMSNGALLVLVERECHGHDRERTSSSSPYISADGNVIAFASASNNLVTADGNSAADIFAKNLTTQAIQRVSVANDGSELGLLSSSPSMSDDGTKISFVTMAATAVSGDANQVNDVFVRDTNLGTTTRVSTRPDATEATLGGDGGRLSPSGKKIAFFSSTGDLDPDDTNGMNDAYVKNLVNGRGDADLSRSASVNVGGNDNSFVNFDVPQW